jgi:hypothetical protein
VIWVWVIAVRDGLLFACVYYTQHYQTVVEIRCSVQHLVTYWLLRRDFSPRPNPKAGELPLVPCSVCVHQRYICGGLLYPESNDALYCGEKARNQLLFLMEERDVSFEAGTEFLNIT